MVQDIHANPNTTIETNDAFRVRHFSLVLLGAFPHHAMFLRAIANRLPSPN
jgi:hypothetical protein